MSCVSNAGSGLGMGCRPLTIYFDLYGRTIYLLKRARHILFVFGRLLGVLCCTAQLRDI